MKKILHYVLASIILLIFFVLETIKFVVKTTLKLLINTIAFFLRPFKPVIKLVYRTIKEIRQCLHFYTVRDVERRRAQEEVGTNLHEYARTAVIHHDIPTFTKTKTVFF